MLKAEKLFGGAVEHFLLLLFGILRSPFIECRIDSLVGLPIRAFQNWNDEISNRAESSTARLIDALSDDIFPSSY